MKKVILDREHSYVQQRGVLHTECCSRVPRSLMKSRTIQEVALFTYQI